MIKLLYGKPLNDNSDKIYQKITEYMLNNQSEKICYIAPTYQMIKDLQADIFKNNDIKAVGETNFLLFKGLINEVLKEATQFKPIIDDVQKELILKEVINKLIEANEIKYFKNIAKYPGFYQDLLGLIKEISLENEIKEDNFLEKINNDKFKELFKIYNRYYEYLNNNELKDEMLQYQTALTNLDEAEMIKKIDLFIIDGFQYLNLYQKKLLNTLSELDKTIWLNINYEKDRSGIYNNIDKITDKLKIGKKIKGEEISLENRLFEHIRDTLFSIEYDKKPADNSLQLISAEDEETEIRFTARKIKELIYDKEIKPEEIGLVVKSQVKYFDLIDEVFNEYNIPYYTSNLKTFKQSGLWILINQFFDLIRNNYERSSVVKILKSNFTEFELKKEALQKIQLQIWDDNIIRGKDLSYILDEENIDYPVPLKKAIKSLINFYKQIRNANYFREYSQNILALLEQFKIVKSIIKFTDEELIVDELKAYNLLESKLKEYEELITKPIDFEEFVYWFKKIFKEQMIASKKEDNLSRVQVLTPSQARNKRFKYIFIPGLLEGEFPAVNYNKWLIKDKERKILENMGLALKTKNDLLITESYLFYRSVLNAKQKVFLTYPTLGEGEGGQIISSFVEEVRNLFNEDTVQEKEVHNHDFIIDELEQVFSLKELKDYTIRRLSDNKLKELISGYEVESLRNSKQYTNADGLINDETILAELKDYFHANYSYSPSALENYVQCPFRFFIERVLDLEEKQEPEDRLEALQLGELYHRILFEYFNNKFPGTWNQNLEQYIQGLESSAQKVFAEYEGKRSLLKGVWRIYREEILNNLKLLIESEYQNEFQTTPFKLEFGFGISKDYQDSQDNIKEPVDIKLINQTMKLNGKIDRVDHRKNKEDLMVYDYKLSDKRGRTKDFFEYNELQLPLYLLAVNKLMPQKNLMGGAYYSVKNLNKNGIWKKEFVDYSPKTNRSSTVMNEENWVQYFEKLKEEIEKLLTGIKNGDYRLDPKECEYCDGKEICRYSKSRVGDFSE